MRVEEVWVRVVVGGVGGVMAVMEQVVGGRGEGAWGEKGRGEWVRVGWVRVVVVREGRGRVGRVAEG